MTSNDTRSRHREVVVISNDTRGDLGDRLVRSRCAWCSVVGFWVSANTLCLTVSSIPTSEVFHTYSNDLADERNEGGVRGGAKRLSRTRPRGKPSRKELWAADVVSNRHWEGQVGTPSRGCTSLHSSHDAPEPKTQHHHHRTETATRTSCVGRSPLRHATLIKQPRVACRMIVGLLWLSHRRNWGLLLENACVR